MNTLLLCDKALPELFTLQGDVPVAQLPVLDKTIAEYHLELVCQHLQPGKVTLITGNYQNMIEARLGSGCRWGVALSYQQSLLLNQDLPVLVIPCDRLSSFDLSAFVGQLAEQPEQSAIGMAGQQPVAYWITERDAWRELLSGTSPAAKRRIQLADAVSKPVTSIRDIYHINLGLVRGEFPQTDLQSYPQGEHLMLASRARVSETAGLQGRSYIGSGSSIGKHASLKSHCAVLQQVMVDQYAHLEDCVIFPNSYVGRWVSIKNALVSGPFIWHMDSGACLTVKEPFLLDRLPSDHSEGGFFSNLLRQVSTTQSWGAAKSLPF